MIDTLGFLRSVYADFVAKQEYPGRPEDFTLSLEPCNQAGTATDECIRVKFAGPRRRVVMDIYPTARRLRDDCLTARIARPSKRKFTI